MKLLPENNLITKILLSITLSGVFMSFWGCTIMDNNPTGAAYLNRIIPSVNEADPLYMTESESVFTESPNNSSSFYLYAYTGESLQDRAQSTILFPPLADSLEIDSVKFYLYQSESNIESGLFSVSVYKWNQEWQDAMDNGEDFPDGLIPELIATLDITEDSLGYSSYSFPLDPGWVETWQDTNGIVLMVDPMNINAYARFYSKQNSDNLKPRLDFYMDGDTTVSETVFPVSDTYDVRKPDPIRSDLLFLDNGTHDRIRLQFDLSDLPEDATLNLARLVLYADTLVSQPDPSEYFNISVYRLTEAYADTLAYDSNTSTSGTLNTGENTLAISVTAIVQGWLSARYENFGFLLKGYSEGLTMDRRGFYTDIQDSSRIPRLELYYTPALTSGF